MTDQAVMNESSNNNCRKRKCSEHAEDNVTKKISTKSDAEENEQQVGNDENNLKRIREIIEREFQHEIGTCKEQLAQLDQSIEEAIKILDKLRYKLVADYYNKQELPQSYAESVQLRGEHTLFDHEPKGAQLPLHGALKKIIGKRPSCVVPPRAAAQQAMQKIDEVANAMSKSQKRREERRMQKLIREKGIVIDHSKTAEAHDLEQAKRLSIAVAQEAKQMPNITALTTTAQCRALNTSRLNNKVKHLIVVGNTSKYLGDEIPKSSITSELAGERVTHKWLVYVQAKDTLLTPLERLIKKIRFYLHSSYRPNDVVDIVSPPFQLSRRGWGDFTLRIKLYFCDELHQKPVDLQHKLVLDKTLSGLQTMGAETLAEIWLRPLPLLFNQTIAHNAKNTRDHMLLPDNDNNHISSKQSPIKKENKNRALSISELKEHDLEDDNLIEFLNRIESTTPYSPSADDIAQIEPTVIVDESTFASPTKLLGTQYNLHKKPNKAIACNLFATKFCDSPKTTNSCSAVTTAIITTTVNSTTATVMNAKTTISSSSLTSPLLATKTTTTTSNNIQSLPNSTVNVVPQLRLTTIKSYPQTSKPSIICLNTLNSVSQNNCNTVATTTVTITTANTLNNNQHAIILPKSANILTTKSTPLTTINNPRTIILSKNSKIIPIINKNVKQIPSTKSLEKKLVQLVDAKGNIKFVEMFVSTTTKTNIPATNNNMQNNSVKIIEATKIVIPTTTTTTTINTIPNVKTTSKSLINGINVQTTTTNSITQTQTNSPLIRPTAPNVFQKEGRIFIRDPMQIKLKQQQKQQMSLLKPQVSLLKSQQKQQQQHKTTIVSDHDYAPTITTTTTAIINSPNYCSSNSGNVLKLGTLHLGLQQTRQQIKNAPEVEQRVRLKFEQTFQRVQFQSMRAAIEFLLRRLPLVAHATKRYLYAYCFVRCNNLAQFHQLPAFKQRACEWLRAKYISECLREHVQLQQLATTYWTTREIVLYARKSAYTPPIKSLNAIASTAAEPQAFSALLRNELKSEEQQVQYESISSQLPILNWMERNSLLLNEFIKKESNELELNVIAEDTKRNNKVKQQDITMPAAITNNANMNLILTVPAHLKLAAELAKKMCQDMRFALTATEQVVPNIEQPLAQIALAHCLQLFIEQLLRRAIANQAHQQQLRQPDIETVIKLQDLGKVLTDSNYADEYDFLTNSYLGVPQTDNELNETTNENS